MLSPGIYLWPFVCFLLDIDLTEEERAMGLFLEASHGLILFQNLKTSNFLDWLCISPKTLFVTVNIRLWLINYPPCY